MKLSNYSEDLEKQESGSAYYLGEDGCFFVKRAGTTQYNKEIEDIKKAEYGFAPKDVDYGLIIGMWLAEHGVTGWDNILDENDNPLKFSRKNARKVFLNPAYFNSLNLLIIQHANDYNNYLHDEIEEAIESVKKN